MTISPTWIAVIAPAVIGAATLIRLEMVRRSDRADRERERKAEADRIEAERAERERALKNSVEQLAADVASKTIRRQEETVDRLNKRIDEYEAANETFRRENRALMEKLDKIEAQAIENHIRADKAEARADRCEEESLKLQAQIEQLRGELRLMKQVQQSRATMARRGKGPAA